ncbi:MAG: hypothetical protein V4574_22005 [Pseudomonadota bacterium]
MDETPPKDSGSLVERLTASARRLLAQRPAMPAGRRDWWIAGAVAVLIAAGPVATIVGAKLLAANAQAEVQRLREQAAPRVAAERATVGERAELVALLRRPGAGATLEALARALPPEASLARVERGPAGLLAVDITAPDPDRLRAALRREPVLARLRDAGQQRGELVMTVSLRETPE